MGAVLAGGVRWLSGVMLIALTVAASDGGAARADAGSIATLGVGTGLGIRKADSSGDGDAETALLNHLDVRLKALGFLGVDFAYDLGRERAATTPVAGELQYAAAARLNALVYLYDGSQVALYLGAGIGGTRLGELFGVDGAGNSYQAGLGLEAYLDPHVALDASFYVIAPGARSVEGHVAAQAVQRSALGPSDPPSWTDFVSPRNHEFMVRLFLFL